MAGTATNRTPTRLERIANGNCPSCPSSVAIENAESEPVEPDIPKPTSRINQVTAAPRAASTAVVSQISRIVGTWARKASQARFWVGCSVALAEAMGWNRIGRMLAGGWLGHNPRAVAPITPP